jgi:hypothetical protein
MSQEMRQAMERASERIIEITEIRWQKRLNTIPEVAAVDASGTDGDALEYTFHQVYKAIQKLKESDQLLRELAGHLAYDASLKDSTFGRLLLTKDDGSLWGRILEQIGTETPDDICYPNFGGQP